MKIALPVKREKRLEFDYLYKSRRILSTQTLSIAGCGSLQYEMIVSDVS
jgi:hypothetical protein